MKAASQITGLSLPPLGLPHVFHFPRELPMRLSAVVQPVTRNGGRSLESQVQILMSTFQRCDAAFSLKGAA